MSANNNTEVAQGEECNNNEGVASLTQGEEQNTEMDIVAQSNTVVDGNVHDMDDGNIIMQQFTRTMTASNVDKTCHGPVRLHYILLLMLVEYANSMYIS